MLTVLALCGSLKPVADSSTAKLVDQLFASMRVEAEKIKNEIRLDAVALLDLNILPGTDRDMGSGDQWPGIATRIEAADIVIFATPIWWANRSSLMQRAIERMDSFTDKKGFGKLRGKTAGIIIKGGEDGGQQVQAQLMEALTYFGFTLPSFCGFYDIGNDDAKTIQNEVDTLAESLVKTAIAVRQIQFSPMKD